MIDFSLIWFVIIVFATLMYVIMDGFDLGIGILFLFNKKLNERNIMINTIAPVWDGNETWLVLGGAGLYGAFPLAYSVITEALSIPLTAMLIGLIFRGVAFEFRFKAISKHRKFWDQAFMYGSLLSTFCQGVVIGNFIYGFKVMDRAYAGSIMNWISPFTIFCGFGLIVAYMLLGSTWLIIKTENVLYDKMLKTTKFLIKLLILIIIIISVWTPLINKVILHRWFDLPNLLWLSIIPVMLFVFTFNILSAIRNKPRYLPFILTLSILFLGLLGLGISIWPNIIPPSISIWEAASPIQSQSFMLIGSLLIIPIILSYTFWNYYIFCGKIQDHENFH